MRFPGFEGEWEKKKLGDVTSWYSGGTPPKDNPIFWDGDIPWISASSMRGIVYSDSDLKITQAGLKKGSKLAPKGSLLILVRGSMLFNKIPIGIVSKDVAFNQDVKSIIVNDYSTSEYILNWFAAFEPKILNMVTGTGIGAGKLDLKDLKALGIKIPFFSEQQKIVSFFSLIHKRIQTQNEIIDNLESLKKGLCQGILTNKLRFKNKEDKVFPSWKERELADVCDIIKGKQLNKEELTVSGTYPCLNGGVSPSGFTEFFNTPENTITISEGGNSCGYVNFLETKFWCGGHCYSLLKLKKEIVVDFLFQYLKFHERKIMSLRVGSGLPNIQKKDITAFKIQLPSKEEQFIIGNLLTNVDEKIKAEKKLLDQFQNQKKYVLQNIFI